MAAGRYHVLLYHGVHPDDVVLDGRNSSGKHLPLARFAAQMKHLAATRPVVAMTDIAAAHRDEAELPDGAVAVTFDDGFLNNYLTAWPVLEAYGIPATFYLAVGFISTGRMIWSDVLEAAILGSRHQELSLPLGDMTTTFPLTSDDDRIAAFTTIKTACKKLPNATKDAVVETVCEKLGASIAADHPLYAFMTWDQVREMNASPHIAFGAHTVDHVSLAKVPPDTMRDQIDRSVDAVGRALGQPCRQFSYPEGQADDYDDGVIAHLQSKGFDHAPSAIDGDNDLATTHPFHIRRMMVGLEGRPYPFADI